MMPRRCSREDRFGARVPAFVALVLLVLALGVARAGEPELEGARREDRGDLIVLHLRGSYYEMGRQQADLLGPEARAVYELQLHEYGEFRARAGMGFKLLDAVGLPLWARIALVNEDSGLYDELKGMADGLGISRIDLLRAELTLTGGSTVFAATRTATADGGAIIGRNADWSDGDGRRRPVVAYYHPTNGDLAYVAAGWPLAGMPVIGVNEAGFALSFNFFLTDTPASLWFPEWPHRRALQVAHTVEEGIRVFTRARRLGMPTFMAMADAGGDIALLECSVHGCAVFRPDGDWFGHANHARTPAMLPLDRYRSEDSFRRRAAIEAAVQRRLGSITPLVAADIMRDRSNSAYVNEPVVANVNVLNAAVVQPRSRTLWHSTTMQPLAPFGEMVPFTVAADASSTPSLPADPRLGTPREHERQVVEEVRRAVRLFDEGQTADAGAVWDHLADAGESLLEPHRLAWARARVRWTMGKLPEADALLVDAARDGAPFEVRAHALVAQALIADREGRRADAVGLYREARAYLDAHPEYSDKFVVVPLAERIAAGIERPQTEGEFPRLGDLQYVPR
jgi:hypothetical protein